MDVWPRYLPGKPVDEEAEKKWLDDNFGPGLRHIWTAAAEGSGWLSTAMQKCESPIESRMADGLLLAFRPLLKVNPNLVQPQVSVGQYRADFAITLSPHSRSRYVGIVIECDGEEFHSTREQRLYDRQRDDWMRGHNYKVFRFTGSQIYQSARDCADKVRAFFDECQAPRGIGGQNTDN